MAKDKKIKAKDDPNRDDKGLFVKGNKPKHEKYTAEFCELMLADFEEWIFGTSMKLQPDGSVKEVENLYFSDYIKHFRETFGFNYYRVMTSLATNKRHYYDEFYMLKDMLAEKLATAGIKGETNGNMTKFYLQSVFKWSERIETVNQNNNTITWNETFISEVPSKEDLKNNKY